LPQVVLPGFFLATSTGLLVRFVESIVVGLIDVLVSWLIVLKLSNNIPKKKSMSRLLMILSPSYNILRGRIKNLWNQIPQYYLLLLFLLFPTGAFAVSRYLPDTRVLVLSPSLHLATSICCATSEVP